MDSAQEADAVSSDGLSNLGPWHDGLGVWLSTFLRVRHLRRAKDRRDNRLGLPPQRLGGAEAKAIPVRRAQRRAPNLGSSSF